MREIERTIVAAVIISKDGKILLGKKDPNTGGVFADCWHIPGGGVDEGETLDSALIREVKEEVGIDISPYERKQQSLVGHGSAQKVLKENGETVICNMTFNRFEVRIDKSADEIQLSLGDDLIEAQWFSRQELSNVQQIPGGKEFFQQMGYTD